MEFENALLVHDAAAEIQTFRDELRRTCNEEKPTNERKRTAVSERKQHKAMKRKIVAMLAMESPMQEETAWHEAGHLVTALALDYGIKSAKLGTEIRETPDHCFEIEFGRVQVDAHLTSEEFESACNGDTAALGKCEDGLTILFAGMLAEGSIELSDQDLEGVQRLFPVAFKGRYRREMNEVGPDSVELANEYVERTLAILGSNAPALDLAAKMLLEKQALDIDDIEEIRKIIKRDCVDTDLQPAEEANA